MAKISVYTSSFSKASSLDSSRFLVVSISRFNPRGFKGVSCKDFAPSPLLLKSFKCGLSQKAYTESYRNEMSFIPSVRDVFVSLAKKACGRDIVLCCYEKDGEFCHRHILSDIVFEEYGYRINELTL